jgi:hypothetical protein
VPLSPGLGNGAHRRTGVFPASQLFGQQPSNPPAQVVERRLRAPFMPQTSGNRSPQSADDLAPNAPQPVTVSGIERPPSSDVVSADAGLSRRRSRVRVPSLPSYSIRHGSSLRGLRARSRLNRGACRSCAERSALVRRSVLAHLLELCLEGVWASRDPVVGAAARSTGRPTRHRHHRRRQIRARRGMGCLQG